MSVRTIAGSAKSPCHQRRPFSTPVRGTRETPWTSAPVSPRERQRCDPINPLAPVTSIRLPASVEERVVSIFSAPFCLEACSVFRGENGTAQRQVRFGNYPLRAPIKDDVFAGRQRLSFFDPRFSALQVSRGFQPSGIHLVCFL